MKKAEKNSYTKKRMLWVRIVALILVAMIALSALSVVLFW